MYVNNLKHYKVDRHTIKNERMKILRLQIKLLRLQLQFHVEFFLFAYVDIILHRVHIQVIDIFVVHHEKIHKDGEYSDVYNRSIR